MYPHGGYTGTFRALTLYTTEYVNECKSYFSADEKLLKYSP